MKKRFRKNAEISLDEIILDSKNMPGFDTERFEGRLEFPLDKNTLKIISALFSIFFLFLFFEIFDLQMIKGNYFQKRAANNFLKTVLTDPPRGEIYDRNDELLIWNEPIGTAAFLGSRGPSSESEMESIFQRRYPEKSGLSLLLGFIGFEIEDKISDISAKSRFKTGKDGIERYYNEILQGKPGIKIKEVDSVGNLVSENTRESAEAGKKIILTIDAKVNSKLYEILKQLNEERGFKGGAGVIMDTANGEILAMTSFPEYNSNILSAGEPGEIIKNYLEDERKPFLNRAVSGIYAPGSVIKPLIALAALNEKVISSEKIIETHGSISVPNPYFPGKYSIFRDWKNHGPVDMRRALAISSDVYFYTIGGGYGDVKGLGASRIVNYAEMFNFGKTAGVDLFGEEKGVIPYPELKVKTNPEDPIWRIGDTYNISIGQGNFQATPVQMAVFAGTLANKGKILKPRLINPGGASGGSIAGDEVVKEINMPKEYFRVVQEGMRMVVREGTASALNNLDVEVAGKTGTAQVGQKYVNSWFIGFWPYENPRYSIAVVLEKGSPQNLVGAVSAVYQLLSWMSIYTPEYLR